MSDWKNDDEIAAINSYRDYRDERMKSWRFRWLYRWHLWTGRLSDWWWIKVHDKIGCVLPTEGTILFCPPCWDLEAVRHVCAVPGVCACTDRHSESGVT